MTNVAAEVMQPDTDTDVEVEISREGAGREGEVGF